MALKYLIEKEFKQFLRNKFMPMLTVVFPLLIILVMPWATQLDIKSIKISIVDNDHSSISKQFVQDVANSTYFDLVSLSGNYTEEIEQLEYGNVDIILEIPSGFENDLVNFATAPIQLSVNAVNSIKGVMGQSYINMLSMTFYAKLMDGKADSQPIPNTEVTIKNMYNPTLNYRHTMVPGLMIIVMLILCGFFPAMNIVVEKENGTIEQLNVTPISKLTFILAKLIPFWIIGLVALSITFFFAWLVYGLVPSGNYATLYLFSLLFILIMTGIGLMVSNHSATMQQALFVMFFIIIICVMMSGLLTPERSMPDWARIISAFTPTKYMVNVFRSVYLKGSSIFDLRIDLIILSSMALFFNAWAIVSYRKLKK